MARLDEKIHKINYIMSEIDNLYRRASAKLGLPDSSMIVLYTICDNEECCELKEIYKRSGMSKQTVNSALRRLEQENIITLSNKDGRAKIVSLTEKGIQLTEKTVRKIYDIEIDIYSEFSGAEIDEYIRLNERFVTSLKKKIKELETEE